VFVLFLIPAAVAGRRRELLARHDYELIPAFTGQNYIDVFQRLRQHRRAVHHVKTYRLHLKFCFLVWLITLLIGFGAYFLAFTSAPSARKHCVHSVYRCHSGRPT